MRGRLGFCLGHSVLRAQVPALAGAFRHGGSSAFGLPAFSLFLALACLPASASSAEFRASAAKTDITPSGSVDLWGYSDRSGPATGKRDPLFAKVLLLDDGTHRLALVTLDLGRTFGLESMNFVRERVHKSAGVEQVFFFASHTHSAPVIDDAYPPGKRPAWETTALERIAAAIEQAATRLEPAKIGTGEGEVFIGHNRRYVFPDGTVKMLWRNATKTPTHPVDPRVGVIRVDGAGGRVIAVVVNYACHPVIFGPDNLRYSADYPSATARVVEEGFGQGALSLFLQGAAGDINPYYDKMRLEEDADKLMEETGKKLGDEALRVARSIETRLAGSSGTHIRARCAAFQAALRPGETAGFREADGETGRLRSQISGDAARLSGDDARHQSRDCRGGHAGRAIHRFRHEFPRPLTCQGFVLCRLRERILRLLPHDPRGG